MYYFDGKFGQEDLDDTLNKLGKRLRNEIFFVQVGANDGVLNDPISVHVKKSGWHGLLIEPLPDVFEKLKSNYAVCDNLAFENIAITDFDGEIELLTGNAQVGELYPNHTVASVIEEQSFFAINDRAIIEKLAVPCSRLDTVLRKHAVRKIDLFVVDVEGADWVITRQLSMEEFHPSVILMEFCQLSSYEKVAFCEHFRNHGYRVYLSDTNRDVIAAKWPAIRNTSLMLKVPFVAEFKRVRMQN